MHAYSKSAEIIIGAKALKTDCAIRDILDAGVRLRNPSSRFDVPREFELMIGENDRRSCRVTWRIETAVGVELK